MNYNYPGHIETICRNALEYGPLVRDRKHWKFNGRRFNNGTVAKLIARGEAVRAGDKVIAAKQGAANDRP